jgi:hypothetical protein
MADHFGLGHCTAPDNSCIGTGTVFDLPVRIEPVLRTRVFQARDIAAARVSNIRSGAPHSRRQQDSDPKQRSFRA